MVQVILVRHSQSEYNRKKLFTGWVDVELSDLGVSEGRKCGLLLQEYKFDIAFTSPMKRAVHTFELIKEKNNHGIPVEHSWKLNERHYGDLEGKSKPEMVKEVGMEQVLLWRRSWDLRPPSLSKHDARYKEQVNNFPDAEQPVTESLQDCVSRVLPYWYESIVPYLREKERVLIVAHGNSIRGIIKMLDRVASKDITQLEIPVGVPLVYELDPHNNFWPKSHQYLGDPEEIKKIIERVKDQVKR